MGEEPENPLHLAAESAEAPRAHYAAKLADYVPIYDSTLRVIKRWIQIGREADPPEPPPLDDPEAMVVWWPRHMKWKVPERLLAAAAKARARRAASLSSAPSAPVIPPPPAAPVAPAAASVASSPPPPAPGAPLVPADFTSVEAFTLTQVLDVLRTNVSFLIQQQRAEAQRGYNSDSFARFQRDIQSITEQIRRTEKSLEDIRTKRGELVPKADVRDEAQRVHTAMAMSLPTELERKLGIPRERARTFVNDWFAHLRASPLFAGTEPKPAAPAATATPLPAAA